MSATGIFIAVFSPLIVSLLKRDSWNEAVTNAFAVLVSTLCYIIGQFFDVSLTWPLQESFWLGLMAAYGGQQFTYKFVFKGNTATKQLEAIGNADPSKEPDFDSASHG